MIKIINIDIEINGGSVRIKDSGKIEVRKVSEDGEIWRCVIESGDNEEAVRQLGDDYADIISNIPDWSIFIEDRAQRNIDINNRIAAEDEANRIAAEAAEAEKTKTFNAAVKAELEKILNKQS